jgi:anion-transporting  ArsA/GET3 family ATPase
MKQLIENHRVIVCTGSGGVGKTTLSAALGVYAARMGKRVLVLTIDPARRLATTLGIDQGADEVLVPGQDYAGSLHAGMIDQSRIFADYIRRHSKSQAAMDDLFNNAFYQQLSTTLSGSQEFTSLSKLVDTAGSGHYDLVILDTPPVAHAVDFLHAPQKLNAVFDTAIISMFMGRTKGFKFASAAWKMGVKMLLGTLTVLTGSEFVATFNGFFSAIDAIAPDIRETNLKAHQLLLAPSTAFVLISSFDQAKILEGESFHDELTAAGYHLKKVIVNRAWPAWGVPGSPQVPLAQAELRQHGLHELADLHQTMCTYYAERARAHTRFSNILKLAEFNNEVVGLPALELLADRLAQGEDAA